MFRLAGKDDRSTVYWCTLAPISRFVICTATFASTMNLLIILMDFVVHGVQDLPNATGEGGSNDRVRSVGFSAITEAQNDFLSDAAVTQSVAALGEPCCAVKSFIQYVCCVLSGWAVTFFVMLYEY